MRQRGFGLIALIGLVAIAVQAEAEDKVWRIGALELVDDAMIRAVTLPELAKHGFTEGRNLSLDVRVGTADQMPELARKLVAAKPDALIAISDWTLHPAHAATKAIPVVAIMGTDPVATGLAANWAHPDGNVTGLSLIAPELEIKRLELLREVAPKVSRVGVLANHRQIVEGGMAPLRAASATAGIKLAEFWVDGPNDYRLAFAAMRSTGVDALLIVPTPELHHDAAQLAALAVEAGLPTMGGFREDAEDGCLVAYGPNLTELYRRLGSEYLARILRGAKVNELPFQGPTRFEFGINLRTARAIGLTVPPSLLARADEVIE